MLKIIKELLLKVIDDIDSGNSKIPEEDELKIIESVQRLVNVETKFSKEQACRYLNMSRASFDNYVRKGLLPKGKKESGFKELFYTKKDLDAFKYRNKK